MQYEFITAEREGRVAIISLNRPDKRNAMHTPMLQEMLSALSVFSKDDSSVLLIKGNGENFCAGGDIAWMQKIAQASKEENIADARVLADLLLQLYTFKKATIAAIHGTTMGGGLGVIAACDIAIAANESVFGLPEVKLGVAPSMISPYVIAAIGERAAHYYFLTGEIFTAEVALSLGLIHKVCALSDLTHNATSIIKQILQNSPHALVAAKELILQVSKKKIDASLSLQTAEHLANLRATPEAQEGLLAFVSKRKPNWIN